MTDNAAQSSGESDRRYRYEFATYGDTQLETEFDTLAQAIGVMAAEGWRFVESTEHHAIFEKPA